MEGDRTEHAKMQVCLLGLVSRFNLCGAVVQSCGMYRRHHRTVGR